MKIAGNVRLTPGPYEVIKSVQGSFNKGNVSLFWETAGRPSAHAMQCFQYVDRSLEKFLAGHIEI